MTRPLRKYHFYVWRILTILLPVIFILALLLRPADTRKHDRTNGDFSFALKKVTNSSAELRVELKSPLRVPSCLVYVTSGPKDILLGKIDHMGSYDFGFSCDDKIITVRLYDAIQKKDLVKTQLSYNND